MCGILRSRERRGRPADRAFVSKICRNHRSATSRPSPLSFFPASRHAGTHPFHLQLAPKSSGVGAGFRAATASSIATLASHYVGTDKNLSRRIRQGKVGEGKKCMVAISPTQQILLARDLVQPPLESSKAYESVSNYVARLELGL